MKSNLIENCTYYNNIPKRLNIVDAAMIPYLSPVGSS